jgi:hypothetical protein
MRLGWIVLTHDRPGQTGRLVERLHRPQDRIFLHVDRAVDLRPFREALGGLPDGVEFLPRYRSRWGTYGIASATLAGMRAAVTENCDYALVISGQDYPIKPIDALRDHLRAAEGAAFMRYFALPEPDWPQIDGGMWRLTRRHYRIGRWSIRLPNRVTPFVPLRRMPLGLEPYAGPNWWCLPRYCLQYILGFLDARPEVARFYRRAAFPAESMLQTVLMNSPLREHVLFEDLRYIAWVHGEAHPLTLDGSHFPLMVNSGAFLARKFDAMRTPELLDLIDQRLLGLDVAA